MSIKIISISTDLGSNRSTVNFKTFDTSTPLHKMTGEYDVEVDGRYEELDSHELIHKLEEIIAESENATT